MAFQSKQALVAAAESHVVGPPPTILSLVVSLSNHSICSHPQTTSPQHYFLVPQVPGPFRERPCDLRLYLAAAKRTRCIFAISIATAIFAHRFVLICFFFPCRSRTNNAFHNHALTVLCNLAIRIPNGVVIPYHPFMKMDLSCK